MMASGSLPQSGGETRGPVSPDNVHETGVSPQWTLRISVETAEAQLVERTQKRPGHGPDPSFCTLQSLLQKSRLRMHRRYILCVNAMVATT
jgi:hypothetical protein